MPKDAFYRWLVSTQIEPTFAEHPFVQFGGVYVVPTLGRELPTPILIAYSTDGDKLYLDSTLDPAAMGVADKNLPPGVTSFDLHRPVSLSIPVEIRSREYFSDWKRSEEYGCYEGLDGFAVYAYFVRNGSGGIECVRRDRQLDEWLDRTMPIKDTRA